MATFRLRHFSSPETLRAVRTDHLLRFLDPFREYLATRAVLLPTLTSGLPPDYDALTRVFLTPAAGIPDDLVDSLYYVDEMATEAGMDRLLDHAAARSQILSSSDDATPADVAVAAYLLDPILVQRAHGEILVDRPRTFTTFRSLGTLPHYLDLPDALAIARLEATLATWFKQRQRGPVVRVFSFDRADELWFLVRHGQPYKREPRLEGDEPSSVAFRPLKHDVLAYNPRIGELRINAETPGEKRLYVREFSRLLFGHEHGFPCWDKYNLEPLRQHGPNALVCHDVEDLEQVTLCEVHLDFTGPHRDVVIRKSSDVFAALAARGSEGLPAEGILTQAVFEFAFAGQRRPRRVRIRVPNVAQYTRDADCGWVEDWLERRGFLDVQPLT